MGTYADLLRDLAGLLDEDFDKYRLSVAEKLNDLSYAMMKDYASSLKARKGGKNG